MVSGSISRDCGLFAEDGSDSSAAPGRCASAAGGATRCACANSGLDDGLGDASGAALADGAADASPGSDAPSAMGAGAKGGRGAIAEPSSSTCVKGLRANQRAHRACAASGRIHPACTAAFRSAQATFTAGTVLRAAPGSAVGMACACARASASFLRRTPSGVWTVSNGVSACQLRPALGRANGSSGRPAAVGLARSGGGTARRRRSSGLKRPERLGGWAGATPSNAPNSARLGSGPRRAPAGLGAPTEPAAPGGVAPGIRPAGEAPAGAGAPGEAAGPGASDGAGPCRGGRLEKMEGFQLEAMLRSIRPCSVNAAQPRNR
jgi:hypothetical protein